VTSGGKISHINLHDHPITEGKPTSQTHHLRTQKPGDKQQQQTNPNTSSRRVGTRHLEQKNNTKKEQDTRETIRSCCRTKLEVGLKDVGILRGCLGLLCSLFCYSAPTNACQTGRTPATLLSKKCRVEPNSTVLLEQQNRCSRKNSFQRRHRVVGKLPTMPLIMKK
jgi:hypothetical protein